MLLNLNRVTQNTFRLLVVGILVSIIYDLFWFSIKSDEYLKDGKQDAGLERTVKMFSLYMSYFSFFLRLIMALVYWKDSLDFDNIMLGKKVDDIASQSFPKSRDNVFLRQTSPSNNSRK
jgi:hypothetical protein